MEKLASVNFSAYFLNMKSQLSAIFIALFCTFTAFDASAQTNLLTEDFEGATLNVSSSSASNNNNNAWGINSTLQVSGSNSDSAQVRLRDTLYLETNSFSTVGFSNVNLSFDQICKIDFFDRAIVEYSTNNGSSWTQLTGSDYSGSGFFGSNSFSSASYLQWNPGNGNAVPTNSWWRTENFDLSAAASNAQVKVRWALIDADNNGAVNNYGWVLDDIVIVGAPCELVPPTIALAGTVFQGLVYNQGPYQVNATITDASGLASAAILYTVNSGAQQTVTMTNNTGSNWLGTIPGANVGDTICYTVRATDNTTCGNIGYFPSINGCTQFIVANNPPPTCVGTPVFNFNYLESFASFSSGNGNGPGTFQNNWVNATGDTHDWWVLDQATGSGGTGPNADHSPGDANFMYVEASGSFANKQAILNTPCYDLTALAAPQFDFYYHMLGTQMGELHLDIYFGGNWILDVTPAIVGNQGPNWNYRSVDLSAYTGNIVKLRFRAITGGGFSSDIAIDDVAIVEPLSKDIGLTNIFSPSASGCTGTANEFITFEMANFGSSTQDTIPVVYSVNNGPLVRDTAFITMQTNDTLNFTFQQTVNMSTVGAYAFRFWIDLPGDQNTDNDSLLTYVINTSSVNSIFPDTNNFDNYMVGTPGTFLGGWSNDPSTDDHDWYVNSGVTGSNGTGPSGDNTSGSGNYLYVEASSFNNQTANLFSKCLDLNNLNQPELTYYYHMNGFNMGELHLDININGVDLLDIIPPKIGSQGANWIRETVDLTPYKGNVKLIFRGIVGNGFQSDIAIDDVIIRDANPVSVSTLEQGQEELKIYPNPVRDVLNLEYQSNLQARLQIFNLSGQIVFEGQLNPNSLAQIDVSDYSSGLYQLKLTNERGTSIQKLLIE